ncbi:hypothetical protein B0A55_10882 [Friedmanniomyces simplex]|uniref:Uncharacterized protein n=1 Tax=Friedmanniomyces simplex TaxID=329884 RepID=A0A4U0WH71_9PEZI|nr:hypothetical protein B0A55_10882 [Friedmanniomyces simplex]
MAFTKIILAAAFAVSAMAAAVPVKSSYRALAERASPAGVEIYAYNLGGQGCNLDHTGSSVSTVTVPLSDNGTCVTFASLGVPFQVKSAESVAYPAGYSCQVDFNNKCGDSQGTYDEGLDHCQTANQYFGGVYILCDKD